MVGAGGGENVDECDDIVSEDDDKELCRAGFPSPQFRSGCTTDKVTEEVLSGHIPKGSSSS